MKFYIEPRFPIWGGWKTDWNDGYSMPTKFHLSTEMNNQEMFVLNCSFLHNYDDILAEDYKVKVILPEGATNIQVSYLF